MHFTPVIRVTPTTYALVRLRAIHDGRSIKETVERLIGKGLEYEKLGDK